LSHAAGQRAAPQQYHPAAAYPPPQQYRPPPRPIQGLGTALSALLGTVVAVDLIGIGVSAHRRSVFQRIIDGSDISVSEADLSDSLTFVVGGVQVLLWVACIVVWLIWFYRAGERP